MLPRLGCLVVLLPLAELALLIQLGRVVGLGPTLGLVVGTGFLGMALARGGGVRTLTAVQIELAARRLPARPLLDGAAGLVGALLLIVPGVLTDVAGVALLLPPTRRFLYGWIRAWLSGMLARGTVRMTVWDVGRSGAPRRALPDIGEEVEGGRRRVDPDAPPRRGGGERGEDDDEDDRPPPRPGEIIQDR